MEYYFINIIPRFINIILRFINITPRFINIIPRFINIILRFINITPRFITIIPRFINITPRFINIIPRFINIIPRFINITPRFTLTGSVAPVMVPSIAQIFSNYLWLELFLSCNCVQKPLNNYTRNVNINAQCAQLPKIIPGVLTCRWNQSINIISVVIY